MKKLTLKNYHLTGDDTIKLESLQVWLDKQLLHGKESRQRTRFIALLRDRATEIEKERKQIAENNCEKNKEKRLIYIDEKEKETTDQAKAKRFKIKDGEKFNKELEEYLQEDFVLNVSPETQDTIYGVRDLLLNTEESFSGIMAVRYEEWATALEVIK